MIFKDDTEPLNHFCIPHEQLQQTAVNYTNTVIKK